MTPQILHLHTYFLFPFSIDKQAVLEDHRKIWATHPHWMDGLDAWIGAHNTPAHSPIVAALGPWHRAPYSRFDLDSPAYQDMAFFHTFVRRVFFDTVETSIPAGEREALIRCYTIPLGERGKLWYHGEDGKGRRATVEVTNLHLFLFANGLGILSIGVEATRLSAPKALWINEALRKVYPSSGRQVREGRIPNRLALEIEREGPRTPLVEERFGDGQMVPFLPRLRRPSLPFCTSPTTESKSSSPCSTSG
jgi:hypothetical protein